VQYDNLSQKKTNYMVLTGQWFSLGTPVSSNNNTDHHDITEIVESGIQHHNPKP
jgi:hypothetical protein